MSMPAMRIDSALFERLRSAVTRVEEPVDRIAVHAPFSGAVLGNLPACEEQDVEYAVNRARAAQPEWAARPITERAAILLRFHDLLLARQDEVLDIIQLESGKAR